MGRFDGLFLIDFITFSNKYDIKGVWKSEENKLLSLKIIDKETRKYIIFMDSMSFLGNLT